MSRDTNFWKRFSGYLIPGALGVFLVCGFSSLSTHAVPSGEEPGSGPSPAASVKDPVPNPYVPELKDVFFDQDSSQIRDDAKPVLDENVEVLMETPKIYVIIESYCEPGEKSTPALGAKRADSVKNYFIGEGVDPDRIVTENRCRTNVNETASVRDGGIGLESRVNFIAVESARLNDSFAANHCCEGTKFEASIN